MKVLSQEDLKAMLEAIASPNQDSQNVLTEKLKSMYDTSVKSSRKRFGLFDKLIVDGLDPDSVWEELNSRNEPLTKYIKKKVFNITENLDATKFDEEAEEEDDDDDDDDDDEGDNKEEDDPEAYDFDYNDDEDDDAENDGQDMDNFRDEDDDIEENDDDYENDEEDHTEDEDTYPATSKSYKKSSTSSSTMTGAAADDDDMSYHEKPLTDEEQDDMEEYLDDLERLEMTHEAKLERKELASRGHKTELEYEEDDEEDEIDYIQRVLYQDDDNDNTDNNDDDEEEEEEEGGIGLEGDQIRYNDFFGTGKKSNNNNDKKNNSMSKSMNRMKYSDDLEIDSEEEEEEEEGDNIEEAEEDYDMNEEYDDYQDEDNVNNNHDDDDDDEDQEEEERQEKVSKSTKKLTKFEQLQQKKLQEIRSIEQELIGQKSWELRGEVRSADRPENSLLEISADMERASKPAPLVTETYTNTLEDMIIQRIKDEKYDDVIPREINTTQELDNDDMILPEVSQEKNKMGLGEIYANEYIERLGHATMSSASASEAEEVLKKTVRGLFHQICRDLDSLSHFYYTPKPIAVEGSVTTAPPVPSITLEDIAPYSIHSQNTASADTLGPEQIYAKKRGREGALAQIADKELNHDDKRRIRRARKEGLKKQKMDEKVKEMTIAKSDKTSKEYQSYEQKKTDDILTQDKRVILNDKSTTNSNNNKKQKMDKSATSSSSSSSSMYSKSNEFFNHLQQQVQQDIRTTSNALNIKKGSTDTTSKLKSNSFKL